MSYLKIIDTVYGELGHNGRTWVIDHPYCADDGVHPAYYEDCGILVVSGGNSAVEFRANYGLSRSGRHWPKTVRISISPENAQAGMANRDQSDHTDARCIVD